MKNRQKRAKALNELKRYQKFQILFESGMIDNEEDRNIVQCIIREFEVKIGETWKEVA